MLIFLFSYFSIECRLLIFGLFSHIVIHVLVVLSWVMVFWLQIVAEHLSNWCINVYGLIIMPWIQAWHAILLVNTECIYQHCWFGLLYLASLCVQQPQGEMGTAILHHKTVLMVLSPASVPTRSRYGGCMYYNCVWIQIIYYQFQNRAKIMSKVPRFVTKANGPWTNHGLQSSWCELCSTAVTTH